MGQLIVLNQWNLKYYQKIENLKFHAPNSLSSPRDSTLNSLFHSHRLSTPCLELALLLCGDSNCVLTLSCNNSPLSLSHGGSHSCVVVQSVFSLSLTQWFTLSLSHGGLCFHSHGEFICSYCVSDFC